MGSHSSRSSTETSASIWQRSKPTRAAWWSFVTRCKNPFAWTQAMTPDGAVRRSAGEVETPRVPSSDLKGELYVVQPCGTGERHDLHRIASSGRQPRRIHSRRVDAR